MANLSAQHIIMDWIAGCIQTVPPVLWPCAALSAGSDAMKLLEGKMEAVRTALAASVKLLVQEMAQDAAVTAALAASPPLAMNQLQEAADAAAEVCHLRLSSLHETPALHLNDPNMPLQAAATASASASSSHAAALAAIETYVVDLRSEMSRLSHSVQAQLAGATSCQE